MLVNQLSLAIAAQQHAEIVEPSDVTLKLNPVHQKDRNRGFALPDCIQKRVLQVLLFFAHLYTRLLIGLASPAKRVVQHKAFGRLGKSLKHKLVIVAAKPGLGQNLTPPPHKAPPDVP